MRAAKMAIVSLCVIAGLVLPRFDCSAAGDNERTAAHASGTSRPVPLSVRALSKSTAEAGVDLAAIPWTEANLETLRQANMADVRRLLSGIPADNSQRMPAENVTEFSWVDAQGNGEYVLAIVQMSAVCCNSDLLIVERARDGRIILQSLPGTYPLSRAIRDLNGDGKKELLIPPPLPHPDWQSFGAVTEIVCPHVYRFKDGRYVEASRDFPNYYDAEVLAPIEKAISDARFRLAHGPIGAEPDAKPRERWALYLRHKIAGLTMERDTILRMIGRDPNAGLAEAHEWANSPDATLVRDAITVFKSIGGHENDVHAASDRLKEERCDVNGFGPLALRGDKARSDWLVYKNAGNGLSFRYPPSMRVEERDPAKFGYDKAYTPDVIVDVVGNGILRFICAPGVKTPEMAAATLRRYRQPSSAEERPCASMEVDGHEAFVGGPSGGPWTVNILQPRACEIFPMAGNDDAPPPHDGKSPLLSIIRTVHFESPRRS